MRRRRNSSSVISWLIMAGLVGGALFVYNSALFERDVPNVSLKNDNGYWNLRKPLNINISDISGVKSYHVTLKTSSDETVLYNEQFISPKDSVDINVKPPRSAYTLSDKDIKIVVEAVDASKWNFMAGNKIIREFELKIDKKRPELSIVGNSYKISKGGSAIVIFKAGDENLEDIYIKTNYGKKFKAQPFYKEGYYISLVAWPVTQNTFRADITVTDSAQNTSKSYIPLYLKNKHYKVSNISIKDKFLKGKIADLAYEFSQTQGIEDSLEQFKTINENVRRENEDLIHEITSKVSDKMISDFNVNKMYPLKNAQVVAQFGDHRKYSYNGQYLSESYHLGLDLASNALAKIEPQNAGEVVYANYNGIYGNMPIVDHGLGLYTLYGHCSSINANRGDVIEANSHLANTGKSGYAMGDHLHFGVLVQGVEVRPQEWMDMTWVKLNITDVIDNAKKIIDSNN